MCNGIDDDCDGLTDDDDERRSSGASIALYADADGDGLGDPLAYTASCLLAPGYADERRRLRRRRRRTWARRIELLLRQRQRRLRRRQRDRRAVRNRRRAYVAISGDCDDFRPSRPPDRDRDLRTTATTTATASWTTTTRSWWIRYRGSPTPTATRTGTTADSFVRARRWRRLRRAGRRLRRRRRDHQPRRAEYCDAIDNDCDGATDDESFTSTGTRTKTADGCGDESDTTTDCAGRRAGTWRSAGDCDDASASISPDGIESCGDGADQDCDGYVDNCVMDWLDADAVVEGSVADAQSGSTIESPTSTRTESPTS